ncbi:hypothetical protein Y1Q_0023113 [Alligator mississippiensis]|uniref:Uncharacterized protein n=1 Tax=Alligator mississippiensis TaxID=8496 RepID=A0A151P095_ALLMI|nr:hypothetical protein Y1Q_0023113 [Alligator mississippiensis]
MPGNQEAKTLEDLEDLVLAHHTLLLAGPDVGSQAHRCLPSRLPESRVAAGPEEAEKMTDNYALTDPRAENHARQPGGKGCLQASCPRSQPLRREETHASPPQRKQVPEGQLEKNEQKQEIELRNKK